MIAGTSYRPRDCSPATAMLSTTEHSEPHRPTKTPSHPKVVWRLFPLDRILALVATATEEEYRQ